MLCKTLSNLYGRDTRTAQIFNVFLSLVWGGSFLLNAVGSVVIALPDNIASPYIAASYFLVVMLLAIMAIMVQGKAHQVLKAFALMLGSLGQIIIANGYVSSYPPLDMMIYICVLFSLWFGGAVLYICKCEGYDVALTHG